jgi:hypothetical protein
MDRYTGSSPFRERGSPSSSRAPARSAELRDEFAGFDLVADRVTAHERDAVDDPYARNVRPLGEKK